MEESLIVLEDLAIGYNGQPLLSGISFSIARDSFTAVLGANGSGKSTLLRTLLGLLPPVEGLIRRGSSGASLVFGYVPQSIHLDPSYLLTSFDVAMMGAYGRIGPGRFIPPAERAFTRECLEAAGALEFARRRFSELSGGQKQRVLIARALVARPDVLVLDEPTAGVDNETTHMVFDFISRLRREKGIAVILVTHDFGAVRRYAGHVVWLHEDQVCHGTVSEILTSDRMAEVFEIGIG